MLIKIRKGWEIPEALATPEAVFLNRRRFLVSSAGLAIGALGLSGCDDIGQSETAAPRPPDPTADLYPAKRNAAFKLDSALTPEDIASNYNNFTEFGTFKSIASRAQALKTRPWEIRIDGEVEKPFTISIDDLIRKMPLEERLYRHRCVEAWAMRVPWTGFALRRLVELAKPLSRARYLKMQTFHDPKVARNQNATWYPWPYVEALTMAEATNDLAFLVTGVYGKPAAPQFGAPLRLAVPWKYGFKSIKSITRFTFTADKPTSFWEEIQPEEYGFWANVNPKVPHQRWSQKTERLLGTGERVPTRKYNGYGDWVADIYKDISGEKLFM